MNASVTYLGPETSELGAPHAFKWLPAQTEMRFNAETSSLGASEHWAETRSVDPYLHWLDYGSSVSTAMEFAVSDVGTFKFAIPIRRAAPIRFDNLHLATTLIYDLEARARGRDAAIFIGYFIQRSFSQRRLAEVNELLASVAMRRITRWSMVALLRSTFSARSLLPAWRILFENVEGELEGAPDRERLLLGLKD